MTSRPRGSGRALEDGLVKAMKAMQVKHLLMELAFSRHEKSPFEDKLVGEIWTELGIMCKQAGHGPGLPEEGDVVQLFEVRLIQALPICFRRSGRIHVHMVGQRILARLYFQKAAAYSGGLRQEAEVVHH